MLWRSAHALFACATFVALISTDASADDCKLGRVASFDFTDNGAIIIPVSIEGTSVRMALDTGSPLSAVDPNVANNLHLAQQRVMQGALYNVSGETVSYIATLHDLGLGRMHASNVHLVVWPSPMSKNGTIGGSLAADLLRHYDVDIDFTTHQVSLFSQDHCPGKVVYWTTDNVAVIPMHVVYSGHVIVPLKLDGQSIDAVLDTGSSYSFISQELASNSFHLSPNSPGMTQISEDGGPRGVPVYRHTFKSLELEGLSISNPEITVFENVAKTHEAPVTGTRVGFSGESGGNTDMILGLNELRHLHLYIAYKEQKLYVSPASTPTVTSTTNASSTTPAAAASPH